MTEEIKYTREELEEKLTDKERIFCHEYIIDWNKARAARASGYSEDTARQIGYEIFTKPYIQQYIEYIRNDIEQLAGLSKLKVVLEWKKLAFSNITDFLEVSGNKVTLKEGKKLSDLPKEVTDLISEIQPSKDGIKFKLYCKDNALTQLSRLMGYNEPDKLDVRDTSLEDLLSSD